MYLQVRLASPRIAEEGPIDLKAFHRDEGRKYMIAYFVVSLVTIATNSLFSPPNWWEQNYAILPMAIGSLAGAIFVTRLWVQIGALAIQFAMWGWFFTVLQPPISD
jgi:fatty acid desaturase